MNTLQELTNLTSSLKVIFTIDSNLEKKFLESPILKILTENNLDGIDIKNDLKI